MSGAPINVFEINESADITEREFSDVIRDWLGIEGILDMRAYMRFRFLEYFKKQFLSRDLQEFTKSVTEEEIAINTLIIDFALKRKYYFTLCLLLSEIQAFSKFDERVKPFFEDISKMSTADMDSLNPILDREQVSRVLRTFNIDPQGKSGQNIHRSYQQKENSISLIQLMLANSYSSDFLSPKTTESHVCKAVQDGSYDYNAVMASVTKQMSEVHSKIKNIDLNSSSRTRHFRKMKATENKLTRLKLKFTDMAKVVDDTRNRVNFLVGIVDQIHLQGQRALQHFSPYVDLVLATNKHIGRMEVAVNRIKRKLTAQANLMRGQTIKRRRLKRLQIVRGGCANKAVQTEKWEEEDSLSICGGHKTVQAIATQTNLTNTVDAHTQSGPPNRNTIKERPPSHDVYQEKFDSLLEMRGKQGSQDASHPCMYKEELYQRAQAMMLSSHRQHAQDAAEIMQQNYELHGRILEQNKRINHLTDRIGRLHTALNQNEISGPVNDFLQPDCQKWFNKKHTDASTNTDDSNFVSKSIKSCKTCSVRRLTNHQRYLDIGRLEKALRSVQAEISALKFERKSILPT